MKRNAVLVTVADNNYVDQAKQLFSSAYWNGGWEGDYLLLASGIPEEELRWFIEKGILVKECSPLAHIGKRFPPVVLNKFYMYTDEFKRWQHVVYMDADIIVRGSLRSLTLVEGFSAVVNFNGKNLGDLLGVKASSPECRKLLNKVDLTKKSFCAGVLAFDTSIIKEESFARLLEMSQQFQAGESRDQPAHNLYFYDRWEELPLVYDVQMNSMFKRFKVAPEEVEGIVLHFTGADKPWHRDNPFHNEWKGHFERAMEIDFAKAPADKKEWSDEKIALCSSFIALKKKQWEESAFIEST